MGNPFDVIAQGVSPVVHRVNAPFVAGMMVRGMPDTIEHRITKPDIGRVDIDLCPQRPRPVRKFAGFHPFKQVTIFRNGTIAKTAFFSETTKLVGLFRRHVIDVTFAFVYQLERELVKPIEVIRSIKRRAPKIFIGPIIDEPVDIGHDGIDILGFFLGRIGVVHPNVADAVELVRDPEVQADRLGMTDVKITIRLRWKAGDNLGVVSSPQIIRHNLADEVGRSGNISGFVHYLAER